MLRGIDFSAKPGQLCVVLGAVGSGKTSLLNGILGELVMEAGSTKLHGTVAVCEQQPWIQAGSVVSKNKEFCIKIEESCIENDGFCSGRT